MGEEGNDRNLPPQESQSPVDDTKDFQTASEFAQKIFIILPITWIIAYKLFFVKKNQFSQQKEYMWISDNFERKYVGKWASDLMLKQYEGRVFKQETDEVKKVKKLWDKLIESNGLGKHYIMAQLHFSSIFARN